MASIARRRPPAAVWSVDDASTFAALKEFKLLQLLSADKKAFATARRLDGCLRGTQSYNAGLNPLRCNGPGRPAIRSPTSKQGLSWQGISITFRTVYAILYEVLIRPRGNLSNITILTWT